MLSCTSNRKTKSCPAIKTEAYVSSLTHTDLWSMDGVAQAVNAGESFGVRSLFNSPDAKAVYVSGYSQNILKLTMSENGALSC